MFLAPALLLMSELEDVLGNHAPAEAAITEAVEVALGSSSIVHWFPPLPVAARLLSTDRVSPMLDRSRPFADRHPSFEARFLEARGLVGVRDPGLLRSAADLYASLELPYEEARCRLEIGDWERTKDMMRRYGFDDGPLGARLRELIDGTS